MNAPPKNYAQSNHNLSFLINQQEIDPLPVGLYVIATPIGNREDITLRALKILHTVDAIVCENKTQSLRLLNYYGIKKPLYTYRNDRLDQERWVIMQLQAGKALAYISDAGTPGIQDPVSALVRKLRSLNLNIIDPIPGASAFATALSVCGMQSNPCLFLGYLSSRHKTRKKTLLEYQNFSGIIVIYESVHRIGALLHDLHELFVSREIFIAREMTKLHAEYIWLSLNNKSKLQKLVNRLDRGEFTLVLGRSYNTDKEKS